MISQNLHKEAYTCKLQDHHKKLQSLIVLKLLHIENQKSRCETYKYPLKSALKFQFLSQQKTINLQKIKSLPNHRMVPWWFGANAVVISMGLTTMWLCNGWSHGGWVSRDGEGNGSRQWCDRVERRAKKVVRLKLLARWWSAAAAGGING